MQKVIVVILIAASVGLAVVNYNQQNRITDLEEQIGSSVTPDVVESEAVGPSERERRLEADLSRARLRIQELEAERLDAAAAGPVVQEARPAQAALEQQEAPAEKKLGNFMESMSEMMKSEEMQGFFEVQAESVIDMNYTPVMGYLQLTEDQKTGLKELLVARQLDAMTQGMDMMNEGFDPDKMTERSSAYADSRQEYADNIKALIGDDNFQVLEDYEKTEPERMQLQSFKMNLLGSEPLNAEQERLLVEVLYEERQSYNAVNRMYDPNQLDTGILGEELLQRFEEESAELLSRQLQAVAGILSASQQAKFEAFMKQQQAMQAMGMRMAQQMMDSGEGNPFAGMMEEAAPMEPVPASAAGE